VRKSGREKKPLLPQAGGGAGYFSRLSPGLLAGVLVAVTVAVYWPATRCDFINFDDDVYVAANDRVQEGVTLENVRWAFLTPVSANWHPVTMLSHMAGCQLFGLEPWGHHLVNILFHALNAALVFGLLRQLTGAMGRSLLVAALFAVHPLRVESVAWISERKDVLSGFFGLLTLICYTRAVAQWNGNRFRYGMTYGLACLFFTLGLLCKPVLVTLPFVLLLLDAWPLQRRVNLKRRLVEKIPFFALAAAASITTLAAQQLGGSLIAVATLPLDARAGNALVSYCRYLGKNLWPMDLAVFYPHPGYWPLAEVLLAGMFLILLSVLFYRMRRRYPYLLMGWIWFLVLLAPMIGLVQTGLQSLADRHTYLSSIGLLILLVWGVRELALGGRLRGQLMAVAGVAAVFICLILTRQQLQYWRDSETLFRQALAVTKNNYLAHNNLGVALERRGQWDEALHQYQEALRLDPDYADARYNLGNTLEKKGQLNEAMVQWREALRLDLDDAGAHINLGKALDEKGATGEAISHYQQALRLKPDSPIAHNNLGVALGRQNQLDAAIRQFQEALRWRSNYSEASNNLAHALELKGVLPGR